MKNSYKKLILLGLCAVLGISTIGCGGSKETSSTKGLKKDYIYVPEYQEIADKSDIGNLAIGNNTIYYSSSSYDEATSVYSSNIKSMEVGGTEGKVLPVQIGENDYVNNLMADSEGNLIYVLTTSTQGETEDSYSQTYTLKKCDKDGNELFSSDLTSLLNGETSPYIQYTTLDGEGNIYLSNGENKIWVMDPKGTMLFSLDVENYMQGLGTSKEGKVYFATYLQDKIVLQEIDFANKKLGTQYDNVPSPNGGYSILKGVDKGCLISTGNSLFEYDFNTKSSEEVLNWIDSDINSDTISAMNVLDDGRIMAVTRSYDQESSSTEIAYLTKKPASEVKEKTVITFGTLYMGSGVRTAVIKFNKENEKYRIHVEEYGVQDYEAGITKLNSDIISGKAPDIIDLSSGNTQQYIEKGVLEDLYPFMEKDSEIKKENYLENALKVYERDGKLFAIFPSFSINTIIGKTSDVGDKMGWTLQDLEALLKSKPEGTEVFEYASKESILSSLCIYGMNQYVDWETGKCSFDSDSFVQLLDFANTFPSDSEIVYDETAESTPSKIQSGKLLLTLTSINNVESYQMTKQMYGEPVTCIGYPTNSGTGSSISTGDVLLAMSSKSKYKDGAWEFIRKFLTSDYQNGSDMWSFPIMKSALDAKFKEAMTPEYYEDENGKQVEQVKGSWGYEDFNVDIYAAKQEDIDELNKVITSVDSSFEYNTEMYSIITEETAPFFAGQKTAKEVADIIQSRIQIYVNENR